MVVVVEFAVECSAKKYGVAGQFNISVELHLDSIGRSDHFLSQVTGELNNFGFKGTD